MRSTKKALLYFYQKINDADAEIIEIEFNKTQKGKIMKFNVINKSEKTQDTNINIIKDFGFSGYYPMISEKSWDKVEGNQNQFTVFVENLYDQLEDEDLYEDEGEKLIIFIYPFNEGELEISNITYVDNLLTIKNKYNIEVIHPNSSGVLIINDIQNYKFYQFTMCKSKEIKFQIESSNNNFNSYDPNIKYPYIKIINENKEIILNNIYSNNEILIHSFESDNEFLFSYNFASFSAYEQNFFRYNTILSIFEIQKDLLQIKFDSISDYSENYYILIAKQDNINNIESFSDVCYISKLFIKNDFNSILVKNIYKQHNDNNDYISDNIDISKLNVTNTTELVVTVISNDIPGNLFRFYEPKEPRTGVKKIQLEENINFNLENEFIFSFEYTHLIDREQTLSLYFNGVFSIKIFLTYNDNIKRVFNNDYNGIINFTLTNSGIYYLEIYENVNSQYYKRNGTFLPILINRLIDIIDFSKKEYKNNKIIKLKSKIGPNYYIITNLKKDVKVEFTFEIENLNISQENPFVVCNNNTDECIDNVTSYDFIKGNNYTIFINYILISYSYYYPSFSFKGYNSKDNDNKDDDNDDGLNTTTLIAIICGSIFGFIILIIVLFFIIRHCKKKNQNIDFSKETQEISNENLLRPE